MRLPKLGPRSLRKNFEAYESFRWLLRWSQREPVPGDEYDGPRQPDFLAIVNDILAFQWVHNSGRVRAVPLTIRSSMPGVLKNVFRLMDSSGTTPAFDANLMVSICTCDKHC